MSSDDDPSALAIEEWKAARELLGQFDERSHDLRKFGFSFLAAFVGADSLLFNAQSLPEAAKYALVAITIVLLLALRLADTHYRLFQEAAATRAMVLERLHGLELTDTISYRYKIAHFQRLSDALYCMFAVPICMLVLMLPRASCGEPWLRAILTWCGVSLLLVLISRIGSRSDSRTVDWTIHRLRVRVGDSIGILATNLDLKHPKVFEPDSTIFELLDASAEPVTTETAKRRIEISSLGSYFWLVSTVGWKSGAYSFSPCGPEKRKEALHWLVLEPPAPAPPEAQARGVPA